jgi:putative membrane protein
VLTTILRSLVGGFFMGTADLVPGVSGGTIALVLGIYPRLVASIKSGSSALGAMARLDWGKARSHLEAVEWRLLLPLLAGILTAVVTLASFLEHQLEARPTTLAAAFFGLVVGSVAVASGMIRSPRPIHLLMVLGVGVGMFLFLGLGGSAATDPALGVFFLAGALAICAMILPGISGSLILVLIGMYAAVLGAVTDRNLLALAVFVAGCVVGLALFSQVLNWALDRYHDLVVAAMVGLMAGSLRVLWPWPAGVDSADLGAIGSDWPTALIAAVVGGLTVTVITRLGGERPAR